MARQITSESNQLIDALLDGIGANEIERRAALLLARQRGGRARAMDYVRAIERQREGGGKGQLLLFGQ